VAENGGRFELAALEVPTTAAQALKLPASRANQCPQWYYLEHRRAIGFDAFIASYAPSVTDGVLVHVGSACGGPSDLLSIAGVTGRFGEIASGGSGFLDGPTPMFVRVGPADEDGIVVDLVPFGISQGTVSATTGSASLTGWVGTQIGWDTAERPWTVRLSDIHDGTTSSFFTASIPALRCKTRSCAGKVRTSAGGLVSLGLTRSVDAATWQFKVRIYDRFGAPRGQSIRVEICSSDAMTSCVAGQFRFDLAGGGKLRYRRRD
jgi:hypothetical protein